MINQYSTNIRKTLFSIESFYSTVWIYFNLFYYHSKYFYIEIEFIEIEFIEMELEIEFNRNL